MSKTCIIYWSGTGNTAAMADAVFEGAKGAGGDVSLFNVSEISASEAASYDVLVLGCPAMGAEVLEECEFEPFFTELEKNISGKRIALFGSYGWGDGEWMREWKKRVIDAGASLIGDEGLIINETPDNSGLEKCRELGKTAAAK
ncbi:MAG: flavodoxin [Clostridia bacterium]|nr:flavodoxin [Clostridia bacterium]